MRAQLQQQRAVRTIHHHSVVVVARSAEGVGAKQLVAALLRLGAHVAIPASERARADAALERAIRWVRGRPPAGVLGPFSRSFYFPPDKPGTSWRFDIEGFRGSHLRQ